MAVMPSFGIVRNRESENDDQTSRPPERGGRNPLRSGAKVTTEGCKGHDGGSLNDDGKSGKPQMRLGHILE